MEQSFSACLEKASLAEQGTGSAILKWFNLQSITEVKSQLETMHLIFGAPRFICSRDVSDLFLHSEVRHLRKADAIGPDASEVVTDKSFIQQYENRGQWVLPSRQLLNAAHPLTGKPFWFEILRTVEGGPLSLLCQLD